jgi:hypothetical protein
METFSEWKETRRKRARWKKQQREGRNKAMKTSDSNDSLKAIFAIRRSSI